MCESKLALSAYDLGTQKYLFQLEIPGIREGDLTYSKARAICMKGLIPKGVRKLRRVMLNRGFKKR